MRVVATPRLLNTALSRRWMMVSVVPRARPWLEAMGTPFRTTRPVKGSDPLQKKPAGIDDLEKLAKVVPSPGVLQRSIPLEIIWLPAKAGTASITAKATIMNTESFFISFLLSFQDFVWSSDGCQGTGALRRATGQRLERTSNSRSLTERLRKLDFESPLNTGCGSPPFARREGLLWYLEVESLQPEREGDFSGSVLLFSLFSRRTGGRLGEEGRGDEGLAARIQQRATTTVRIGALPGRLGSSRRWPS